MVAIKVNLKRKYLKTKKITKIKIFKQLRKLKLLVQLFNKQTNFFPNLNKNLTRLWEYQTQLIQTSLSILKFWNN
jgi:hypothetical protein